MKALCAAHAVEYRADGEAQVVARNWRLLRRVAHHAAEPGAPSTRSDTVWSRRQSAAWTAASTQHASSAQDAGVDRAVQ